MQADIAKPVILRFSIKALIEYRRVDTFGQTISCTDCTDLRAIEEQYPAKLSLKRGRYGPCPSQSSLASTTRPGGLVRSGWRGWGRVVLRRRTLC